MLNFDMHEKGTKKTFRKTNVYSLSCLVIGK